MNTRSVCILFCSEEDISLASRMYSISFLWSIWLSNSLGSSDVIWRWRSWTTLVQVMAGCLTAPSHYLNQCGVIFSKVQWHSSEDIIIRRFRDNNQSSKIEDYISKITLRSPRGQWVNYEWSKLLIVIANVPENHSVHRQPSHPHWYYDICNRLLLAVYSEKA